MDLKIVLVGLGGQGILFATKVFAETSLFKGYDVTASETHGMSQRGGSVISHLKIGNYKSPLVRSNTADVIFGIEDTEVYRNLRYLRKGGMIISSSSNPEFPVKEVEEYISKQDAKLFKFDSDSIALSLNAPLVSNIVLIGYACSFDDFPFKKDDIIDTIKRISPPKLIDLNLKAFDYGYNK